VSVRYILPDGTIREVEGVEPPKSLLDHVELDGTRFGVSDMKMRDENIGTAWRPVLERNFWVTLRPLNSMERDPIPQPPAPARSYSIRALTPRYVACVRTGAKLDGERSWAVFCAQEGANGFLSRAVALDEAPDLASMVEKFYADQARGAA
jgi:hypothetical protein